MIIVVRGDTMEVEGRKFIKDSTKGDVPMVCPAVMNIIVQYLSVENLDTGHITAECTTPTILSQGPVLDIQHSLVNHQLI